MVPSLILIKLIICTTIYIANLSKRVKKDELDDKFSQYGPIASSVIVTDPITRYVYYYYNFYYFNHMDPILIQPPISS